jgi:puromycin-sensitive aminopeptidase
VRQALTRSTDPKLLIRTLELALSDEVRPQDSITVIGGVLINPHGTDLAWNFIKDNWQLLEERYGEGGKMLDNIPAYAGRGFNRNVQADQLTKFFLKTHPLPVLIRPTKQAIEGVLLKNAWYERDGGTILEWMKAQ